MDPDSPFNHSVKAQAFAGKRDWSKAESSARAALALDGDFDMAENLLTQSLQFQNKLEEGESSVNKMLADNPQNFMAHYNAGWAAMRRHDSKKAELHFRESLRLDPDFDPSRDGLLESFRGRSRLYRIYLRYIFWVQRFSEKSKWLLIIGIYLGFKFGSAILELIHPVLAALLTVTYILLVFGTWLAPSVGNLLIYADSSARMALKRGDRLKAIFGGAGFLVGLALIAAGFALPNLDELFTIGLALGAAAIPASMTFDNGSKAGRWLFGGLFVGTYVMGILSLVFPSVEGLLLVAAVGCLFSTWLGNVESLRCERPK
ncbi:MAG: tetratricopeptide repeat protein [Verrucomicrobiota bacterium]